MTPECPQIGSGGEHSEGTDYDTSCQWCGYRPRAPLFQSERRRIRTAARNTKRGGLARALSVRGEK